MAWRTDRRGRKDPQGAACAGIPRRAGQRCADDDATAFNAVLMALEVFQQTPAEFYPYTSKYDAVLRAGKADRAGTTRPAGLQRSRQGQLRRLPSGRYP
jgi:hypothetical protein